LSTSGLHVIDHLAEGLVNFARVHDGAFYKESRIHLQSVPRDGGDRRWWPKSLDELLVYCENLMEMGAENAGGGCGGMFLSRGGKPTAGAKAQRISKAVWYD
jgi:hypothetical protein